MREEGEPRAEELVEEEAVEEMADVGAPVREELHEVREDDLAKELPLSPRRLPHQQPMGAVEEVLVVVEEGDHLLQDLQVRHLDQSLQRVDQIHVVQLVLELLVVVRTDLRVREAAHLRHAKHVVQSRLETTLVFDWLQHTTTLKQTQKIQSFPAGRYHVYKSTLFREFHYSPAKTEPPAAA